MFIIVTIILYHIIAWCGFPLLILIVCCPLDDLPMEPSPQPGATTSGVPSAPKSGIKLVLKVGGASTPVGNASPNPSISSGASGPPLVAYSSTVPAPTPLFARGYPPSGGEFGDFFYPSVLLVISPSQLFGFRVVPVLIIMFNCHLQ